MNVLQTPDETGVYRCAYIATFDGMRNASSQAAYGMSAAIERVLSDHP